MRLTFFRSSPQLYVVLAGLMMVITLIDPGRAPAQAPTPTPPNRATPSLTPTGIPTLTTTQTASLTETSTPTQTTTPTPTWTPVIQTLVVPQTVIVPQPVNPAPIIIFPTFPPPPTASLPKQSNPTPAISPTPGFGWQRLESDAFIPVIGTWGFERNTRASGSGYRQSASAEAMLRLPFTGDGVRVIYRQHRQGGRFELLLDGMQSLDIIDTHAEEDGFAIAGPYFMPPGYHVLDVVAITATSGQSAVGIDAVEVFTGPPLPPAVVATANTVAELSPQPVADIVLISAPPTPQPTATPPPDVLVAVEVIVVYDLNRNSSTDPDEGVQGISARMLDTSTNRLLASGLTDERGFVRLQALTANPVTVVVPYFGETFSVRAGRGRPQSARWTLLLDAGTQPGLIP